MALYSELLLKSDHDPVDIDRYVIKSFTARFACPIAWLALFNAEQIDSRNFVVVSPTILAIQTLEERSAVLSLALGQSWVVGIDQFIERLKASKFLQLNLQDWFGESSEFESYLQKDFKTFAEPFYSSKVHIFSRKPKISKNWSRIVCDYKNESVFGGDF